MASLGLLFGTDGWAPLLLQGAAVTILLAVATLPVGFGAGLLLALLRRSGSRVLRALGEAYSTFFRGIPDLLALFIVYFGLQALLDRGGTLLGLSGRLELNAFVAGVIALGAVLAAYASEVCLASFAAVPPGQAEAARALGLGRRDAFHRVILPQLIRVALPGFGNLWASLVKDTSLISTLAVMDLLRAASEAARNTREPLLFYTAAGAAYLAISIASNAGQAALERRYARSYA